jgi:hypothetical protein
MIELHYFLQLYETFSELADFTTVYTQEAHPTEADDFKNFAEISNHKYVCTYKLNI